MKMGRGTPKTSPRVDVSFVFFHLFRAYSVCITCIVKQVGMCRDYCDPRSSRIAGHVAILGRKPLQHCSFSYKENTPTDAFRFDGFQDGAVSVGDPGRPRKRRSCYCWPATE